MSLPTHLRDMDPSLFFCTLSKHKETNKNVIKLHPKPGRRTNISAQLGDDDMVDAEGNSAPLVPLKGPSSFEDTQPDKPSIFTRCADVGTARVLQAIDELLPKEMERLGLDKEYKPENYRPLYHTSDPESNKGDAGAISLKFDKKKCPVTIMELEDPDDDESEIAREGNLDEIQPGITESMYTKMSISSIWKGRGKNADWGATIWVNKIAVRIGVQDDGLVIGSKVLRGDNKFKEVKPKKRSSSNNSSSTKSSSKRIKRDESEDEGDDFSSTAPAVSRSVRTEVQDESEHENEEGSGDEHDEGSDHGSMEDDDEGSDGENNDDENNDDENNEGPPSDGENEGSVHEESGDENEGSGDEGSGDESPEEEEEEERVPTPPPAPKPKKSSSKKSSSSSSKKSSRSSRK